MIKVTKFVKAIMSYEDSITKYEYYIFIKKVNSNRFVTGVGLLIEDNNGNLRTYDSKFFQTQ